MKVLKIVTNILCSSEDITGAIHHLRNWSPWSETNRSPTILTTPTLLLMGDSDTWLPLDAGYKSAGEKNS